MLLRLLILLLISNSIHSDFELVFSARAPSDKFYSDHLDNIYFIASWKIVKIAVQTDEILEYGSFSEGGITSADVSNPFQLLIFYRDFNRVAFLDNKLSPIRSAINLTDLGIEQALLVCSSGRGGMWVFSDRDNRLVYFDQQLRSTHRSMVISSVTDSSVKPVFITEAQNNLFLHIPRTGILVFDRFASYVTTIPYTGPEQFQVLSGRIIYFNEGELFSLDIESRKTERIELPQNIPIDNVSIQTERLFLLSDRRIAVYLNR